MKRAVLPLVTLGLLVMVVADRLLELRQARTTVAVGASSDSRSATVALDPIDSTRPEQKSSAQPPPTTTGTPTIERLARLAVRQQLSRMAGLTYLDSLIASTDSVVRRWPDAGTPLRVAIIEGGAPGYQPRMAGYVREALGRWEGAGIGTRFTTTNDTSGAEIQVRWIDHFDFDRAGQTDLTWDQAGQVRKALILLALRTSTGITLPDAALLTVAVHEVGHALGLPHSPDSGDVMFPATQTGVLSDRDRRTAQVLYQLPTGPVRDLARAP
ncbi:MAG TPA: matrixin family metalloprotease [Gemmatimonadales bacterium]|nr:matrixin family metalloprotease [Gemmatimonadales bacterium]